MAVFVFEIVSELFLFVIMPLFATVAAVWTFWNVLAAIDPNEVKSIQSFLTVIVVVVPFVMLVFYGLAVVMYDQLMTASGSWRAVFLPLKESPWVILAGAVIYFGLTVWTWSHWRKLAISQ
jgi:hypothetical protein